MRPFMGQDLCQELTQRTTLVLGKKETGPRQGPTGTISRRRGDVMETIKETCGKRSENAIVMIIGRKSRIISKNGLVGSWRIAMVN